MCRLILFTQDRKKLGVIMPRRELRHGRQVAEWLLDLGNQLRSPGRMTLIGSAALLWHAYDRGLDAELPESSMDVDPVTENDDIALLCYEAMIGSEFERTHGWHVNLLPGSILNELPAGWMARALRRQVGNLELIVPGPEDLPKLKRNEPRDRVHCEWAKRVGLLA